MPVIQSADNTRNVIVIGSHAIMAAPKVFNEPIITKGPAPIRVTDVKANPFPAVAIAVNKMNPVMFSD